MDEIDKQLAFEENRSLLIEIRDGLTSLKTLTEEAKENYVAPKEEVTVKGELTVNTEKEVEVSNLDAIKEWLEQTGSKITEAIDKSKVEPITEITVKNIKEAIVKDLSINNWQEFAKLLEPMVKAVEDKEFKTVVTKQDLKFPTSPKEAIPVRLSDGKAFYTAMAAMTSGLQIPRVQSTDTPTVYGVPIVNPDGSSIAGGSGGGDGAITDGVDTDIKATVKDLTNSNPVATQIMDANGDAITSFGGGTQYTEADVDASFTGTMSLVEGAGNTAVTLKQPTQPTDTQPISAASLPLPTGAATSAKQDDIITAIGGIGGDGVQYTEGDVDATITGTASMVEGAANALAVMTQPLTDTQLRATAVPVSGTFYQATQPVSLASVPSHAVTNVGTFAVQVTSAPSTIVTATDLDIRNLAPATDTVAIGDGTSTATVRNLAANDALNVAITDGSGNQITSFGGGTQYTEGDVDASITGTALMVEGAGDTLVAAPGTAADGLLVNLGANNDITGTVTANLAAGTNNIGDVDVLTLPALPAGTNAIGKLAANSGVDIGDVTLNNTLGAGTSDASTIRTTESTGATATLSNVSASATSVTLIAANTARVGLVIVNDSTSDMYLKFGSGASTTSHTYPVPAGEVYIWEEKYNGLISGIWNSATGTARVTEVS